LLLENAPAAQSATAAQTTHCAMGTVMTHKAFGLYAEDSLAAVCREVAWIEGLLSRFLPDSEISRVNGSAGIRSEKVSLETYDALSKAVEFSRCFPGCFDVTIKPLPGELVGAVHLDPGLRGFCRRLGGLPEQWAADAGRGRLAGRGRTADHPDVGLPAEPERRPVLADPAYRGRPGFAGDGAAAGLATVIGGVKAAFVGYNGERIYEDLALLLSGIFGLVIGLVVL
jgi:hypothetical protein